MSLCRECKPDCQSNYYSGDSSCPRCRGDALILLAVELVAVAVFALLIAADFAARVNR